MKMESKTLSNSMTHWKVIFLLGYLASGLAHELAHLFAAKWLSFAVRSDDSLVYMFMSMLFGRSCQISSMETAEEWEISFVRHSGWIFSLVVAILFQLFGRRMDGRKNDMMDPIIQAATVTALEAISTDLLGCYSIGKTTFMCGNFGVIMLNDAWVRGDDNGKTVLDLLERMIAITMMRGAQTGGVLAWTHRPRKAPIPVRVRVVNGKRTDLSEQLRIALNSKLCSFGKLDSSVRCLLGHTRFATSSKATMDGTHPHCWCPPQPRRVYPMDNTVIWGSTKPNPLVQTVSNFITHNGDLDFFKVNGQHVDLKTIQPWLVEATGHPMPCSVDSAAIAGLVDLLRTAGCFSLSIRYAFLLGCRTSKIVIGRALPSFKDYEGLAMVFEISLSEFCRANKATLTSIRRESYLRDEFVRFVKANIEKSFDLANSAFDEYAFLEDDDEEHLLYDEANISLFELVQKSVDAFFDNDLFLVTRLFMKDAIGSFGLMVTSSMDAHRQICVAARGQPMSVAFFPLKGIICYGSELAAVKAGMQFDMPGGNASQGDQPSKQFGIPQETCRYDLDDLGGEVVLLDWSSKQVEMTTYQETKANSKSMRSKVTSLENNDFLLPLTPDCTDPIGEDIASIPKALHHIQSSWKEGGLNRLTAWNLGRKLRERLDGRARGSHHGSVDIMLTGCEVSLWLAEQLASDLQRSFPKLAIQATSSNKLLGLLGQELNVPSIGFPMSDQTPDLKNTIVIIVSHSGGTFAPLAISNLLQSVTKNIFVVTSEWDCQIGKQLRAMYHDDKDIFGSRVFSTDIGVRPAEPCSLSVAATHQLLTQIFEYLCLVVLEKQAYRDVSGAMITEPDLRVLERCNQDNIVAMERIVGVEVSGKKQPTLVQNELKMAGNLWADHVLENARAYIMSFLYVVGTVTSGYPLITGIAIAAGLDTEWAFYITRFFDALIYFFLPQINILIIRLWQGRTLIHRMTGRTVVIGDVPWVAQCMEAFLSKIFARSYSIAGLSVLSGNPADHLVHRHTHRVVRGSLIVCGRPDGRLTALTSAECAVCLSVNQASSIQSLNGTCESITIGHNPAKLGLTKMDIALTSYRPKFLCEQILDVIDEDTSRKQHALASKLNPVEPLLGDEELRPSLLGRTLRYLAESIGLVSGDMDGDASSVTLDRSLHSLKGAYLGIREKSQGMNHSRESLAIKAADIFKRQQSQRLSRMSIRRASQARIANPKASRENSGELELIEAELERESMEQAILESMINEKQRSSQLHAVFNQIDSDGSGTIDLEEFTLAYRRVREGINREDIEKIFHEADVDGDGELGYEEFVGAMSLQGAAIIRRLHHAGRRNEKGLLEVKPSIEEYFGAELHANAPPGIDSFAQAQSQHFSMELYESRVASLQRFVSMCVMFHAMGKRVQDFFPKYSFGVFGYKMERTHSIMRIATTASPVSGDAVREQMQLLKTKARYTNAVQLILESWYRRQQRQLKAMKKQRSGRMTSSTRTISDSGSTSDDQMENGSSSSAKKDS